MPGGTWSIANAINDTDHIVGQGQASQGGTHAMVYYDGTMCDLNSLISPSSGWVLTNAAAINAAGQIVGAMQDVLGTQHAFLLTPALTGDANLDGTVNGGDLNTVLAHYNQTGMTWAQGDFDDNGTVNGGDLNTVLANYNRHLDVGAAVPERVRPLC